MARKGLSAAWRLESVGGCSPQWRSHQVLRRSCPSQSHPEAHRIWVGWGLWLLHTSSAGPPILAGLEQTGWSLHCLWPCSISAIHRSRASRIEPGCAQWDMTCEPQLVLSLTLLRAKDEVLKSLSPKVYASLVEQDAMLPTIPFTCYLYICELEYTMSHALLERSQQHACMPSTSASSIVRNSAA